MAKEVPLPLEGQIDEILLDVRSGVMLDNEHRIISTTCALCDPGRFVGS
jgi:hypothetical protein